MRHHSSMMIADALQLLALAACLLLIAVTLLAEGGVMTSDPLFWCLFTGLLLLLLYVTGQVPMPMK